MLDAATPMSDFTMKEENFILAGFVNPDAKVMAKIFRGS